jgi:predicted NUDIX family NTP pyrophosphohydrolase
VRARADLPARPAAGAATRAGGSLKRSAGILLHRTRDGVREVLLVHPGGPFWANKDAGAWSIPKGEYEDDDPRACALREFEEELGTPLPAGAELTDLGTVKLKSGKQITAYAVEGDLDADAISSNTFAMEWPPRSGKTREFPEVDRAGWFDLEQAREKLNPAQAELLVRLPPLP